MEINNTILLAVPGAIIIFLFILLFFKNTSQPQKMKVKLLQKQQITHDSIIFTFQLPQKRKYLGLKIGEHIEIQQTIKGQLTKRKYTPISHIDMVGSFQLLLKIYHPNQQFPNGGMMSSYLESLQLGKSINISLPYGRFNYIGKSNVQITDFEKRKTKRKYDRFYMVAGGTGITPIFQILQYTCERQTPQNNPQMILLFANRTEQDILLQKQLRRYANVNPKLRIYFSIDRKTTDYWEQFVGFVDDEKISKTLPQNLDNTLFLSCGPPILSNIVQKIWRNKGVNIKDIYRF